MKEPYLITKEEILKLYKPVDSKAHKGTQGHAVIIAGSYGKIGASVLASKSCLKSGCGLVTTFLPKCGYQILQISIPEVMVATDENVNFITNIHLPIIPQAIGIGPGIGKELGTQKALFEFLRINKAPLVLDADALNIISEKFILARISSRRHDFNATSKRTRTLNRKMEFRIRKISKNNRFLRKIQSNCSYERRANIHYKQNFSLRKHDRKRSARNRRKRRCPNWNSHKSFSTRLRTQIRFQTRCLSPRLNSRFSFTQFWL